MFKVMGGEVRGESLFKVKGGGEGSQPCSR